MPFANDCLDVIGFSPSRLYTLSIGQNCEDSLPLQLINPIDGSVCDLTVYDIPEASSSSSNFSIDALVKHGVEIVTKDRYESQVHLAKMATLGDTEACRVGSIVFDVDAGFTKCPGLFLGMAIVWQHGIQRKQFPFYFQVTATLDQPTLGPLTIAEIRLSLRDTFPEVNFLLDAIEFSDEEIAFCIRRQIEYWNEALPPVASFHVHNFPYRYNWLNAVTGELLVLVALWMRRNDLDYNAAGMQVMDTKKWPDYYKIGQERKKEWKEWVTAKKVSLNVAGAYGTLTGWSTSPYR